MHKLEVFFDYICPFCLKGHEYLLELLPQHTDIEIIWRPCESHPRPDRFGPHSDLVIRAMFFARDRGADLMTFHEMMYSAVFRDRIDIEDAGALASYAGSRLDADALRASLQSGEYEDVLAKANRYAFEQNGVWAVPAYRMEGRKLDSVENIGVTKTQLNDFLNQCSD